MGNQNWREAFVEVFRGRGCKTHTTPDGETALYLAERYDYDVVVIGESVERLSPVELIMSVIEVSRERPVIAVSSGSAARLTKLGEKMGIPFLDRPSRLIYQIPQMVKVARSDGHGD
jgi:DNA-binding response OmpR family regulator